MRHWIGTGIFAGAVGLGVLGRIPTAQAGYSAPFRTDMLLTASAPTPHFDALSRLQKTIVLNYKVGPFEDLWSICRRFHIDAFSIRSSNDLDVGSIPAGTVLRIPNHKGTLYQVRTPENLQSISRGFSRGKLMGSAYDREILEVNDYPLPDLRQRNFPFQAGTVLFLPDAWKPTGLEPPFSMKYLSSGFGMRRHPVLGITRPHKGFDLARPYGSPVMVTRDGVVTYAGWMGGYGNMIEVRHVLRNGIVNFTRYGHLSKILVHVGQHVRMYQLIGRVGSTGISTGPHLHYEVRDENGVARNPGNFM